MASHEHEYEHTDPRIACEPSDENAALLVACDGSVTELTTVYCVKRCERFGHAYHAILRCNSSVETRAGWERPNSMRDSRPKGTDSPHAAHVYRLCNAIAMIRLKLSNGIISLKTSYYNVSNFAYDLQYSRIAAVLKSANTAL